MDSYVEQFQAQPMEAYTTLLLDAIAGDQTLFKHREEIEAAWRVVQPVLEVIGRRDNKPRGEMDAIAAVGE